MKTYTKQCNSVLTDERRIKSEVVLCKIKYRIFPLKENSDGIYCMAQYSIVWKISIASATEKSCNTALPTEDKTLFKKL